MQLTKPIHITAVGSSILVGLVAIILCILKWTHTIELSWVVLIGIVLGTGVISLILFAYLINRFVSRKIKFIYSIITNRQELDANDFSLSEEAMGKLTQDTANWAKIQKKQIKDLKKQAAFRKEFLGNLAHELKTPVFSIQGYILTLLEGGLEDERVNRDFLVRALSCVDRISNLLD